MNRLLTDESLFLPEPPALVPDVGPPSGGHALAGRARDGDFVVAGELASVHGSQRGPLRSVRLGAAVVATDVVSSFVRAANLVTLPGLARRELLGTEGTCVESVVAAPTLPLVGVQWSVAVRTSLRISLDLPVEAREARYRTGKDSLTLRCDGDRLVSLGLSPAPERFDLEDLGDSRVRCVAIWPPDTGTATLILASGAPSVIRSCFAAASHLDAHARRGSISGVEEGLRLSTGSDALDAGVIWARVRLRDWLVGAELSGRSHPSAVLAAGIAASGVGDLRSTRRAHALLERAEPVSAAILAGRLASVFGEPRAALAHARAFVDSERRTAAPVDREAWPLALDQLADGLRHSAPQTLIEELRDAASAVDGVRLPVIGAGARRPGPTSWLASLLAGEPVGPPDADGPDLGPILRSCADFRVEPGSAWAVWRRVMASGLADGPSGPGSWDEIDSEDLAAPAVTAALLSALAYGLLGMAPDAPSGRIRLAPSLPSHLTRFGVDGIPVGSARLSLRYRREGRSLRYDLDADVASVPPVVVFEPSLPGRVRAVQIDGADADLESRSAGARTVLPVQLGVDGPRTMVISTE